MAARQVCQVTRSHCRHFGVILRTCGQRRIRGAEIIAIHPWPHQIRVSEQVISTYPSSYLLCDGVGLGKTIEAGPDRAPTAHLGASARETALYNRIEEYISDFYNKYEPKRAGLGFILTVYRRRLTNGQSSNVRPS